jgi:hypothetical protein
MKKYHLLRNLLYTLLLIALCWAVLTFWVEQKGPAKRLTLGHSNGKKVLIVYDPDPFYNLDEQLCLSLGNAFANKGLNVTIVTVAAGEDLKAYPFDLYVYCANTYNWRPDWAITDYIKEQTTIAGKPVVALTLGAGSTEASQKHLERLILSRGANLMSSRSLWLWRPNDESKLQESNTKIAISAASLWGEQIVNLLEQHQ